MKTLKGSCLCKTITFEVTGKVKKLVNCHCSLCRKMNGAAFSTYAAVLSSDFQLKSGQLSSFKVSEHATKHFCADCGTPIFNSNPKLAGLNILHFGALETPPTQNPDVNIYCESELEWTKAISDIPRLDKGIG